MPNHVKNIITAAPEVLRAIAHEGGVDFNLIVPEPENIERGGCNGRHESGVVCWYEWSYANWGTKWNAYASDLARFTEGVVTFETAWNHPTPVVRALSMRFPEAPIHVQWADEDMGYNVGRYTILAGEADELPLVQGSAEALALAESIWGRIAEVDE